MKTLKANDGCHREKTECLIWTSLHCSKNCTEGIKNFLSSPPTCPGPQLLRFRAYVGADRSGKLNAQAFDSYGSYDVVGYYALFVQGKNPIDNDWHTIDEILGVVQWIADGWYAGEDKSRFNIIGDDTPIEPFGEYTLEKRRRQISAKETEPFSDLPRLIRVSTSNTYSSSQPYAYIPIKIETRDDEDTQWNTSPGGADYWLYVLHWFQEGLYEINDSSRHISCVFERI